MLPAPSPAQYEEDQRQQEETIAGIYDQKDGPCQRQAGRAELVEPDDREGQVEPTRTLT